MVYSGCAVQIKPTITCEQYLAALKAVIAAKPKVVRTYLWWEYVILALICLAFGLGVQFRATRIPALTAYAVVVLFVVACKPLTRRSQNNYFRRIYAEEQATLNDQVFTVDELGIACDESNGKLTSHYTWGAFVSCIDMADAFLFLLSPNRFVRIPKETLSESDRERIEQWSSRIPRIAAK